MGGMSAMAGNQAGLRLHRLSREERIAGIATFVLFVMLFCPWWSVSVSVPGYSYSASVSGISLHPFLWLVALISLAILAFLAVKVLVGSNPVSLPLPDDIALIAATGVSLVLVLLGFVFHGYHFGYTIPALGYHAGTSYGFGAILGLVAALVAVVAVVLPLFRQGANKA
jgi:hypothetical protein